MIESDKIDVEMVDSNLTGTKSSLADSIDVADARVDIEFDEGMEVIDTSMEEAAKTAGSNEVVDTDKGKEVT